MRIVSNSIKQALSQPTTIRKGKIVILDNNSNLEKQIFNVEYYADCYDEGNIIGNAIATELKFDIDYVTKFDKFKYYEGIFTGEDYEYIDMGTFEVFDEQNTNNFKKRITAYDNLIKFNVPYEDSVEYPCTLYDLLENICRQADVELINETIPNGTFEVVDNQFVNGENLKTVLKGICGISGTFAMIKNDMLFLNLINETEEEIDKSYHQITDWKRRTYGINQVIIGMKDVLGEYVIKQDDEDIELNGIHKLEINDNPFSYTQDKRESLIDDLYEQVLGFGYVPYEQKGEWLPYLELGDTINIDGTDTIVLRILGKSPNAIESEMSAPAIIDSAIDYVDNTDDINNKLKRTEITVDKANQQIQSVISNVTEQNNKISQITQTVDEINQKISDIADVTVSGESNVGDVVLENVNASEPITIKVRPLNSNNNISYLYPNSSLYPSSTTYLKTRKIRFIRTYEEEGQTLTENIDYELPDDLLYYDSTHYDEFYLSYDSQTCQITKKCKYNADGTVGLLSQEEVNTYTYPSIVLGDGDYEVQLLGYDIGYLYVQLMASNIYTTQFATRVEMNSAINQKADEISLVVEEKLDSDEFTHAKIVAKINDDTSQVQIEADKIDLNGIVTANENFKILLDGSMECNNATINGSAIVNGNNFNVDENGNMECNNANITGGNIELTDTTGGSAKLNIINSANDLIYSMFRSGQILMYNELTDLPIINISSSSTTTLIAVNDWISQKSTTIRSNSIICRDIINSKTTTITPEGITTPTVTQTSLEESKKNFEKLDNALSIVKDIDIYKYNFKSEKDDDKKHIGFVIGKDYKYREEVTSKDNDGVDIYSLASLCLQAIKEQQQEIIMLKKEINELKKESEK